MVDGSSVGRIDPAAYGINRSDEYMANFDRWFCDLVGRPISILELGIQRGGSLRYWHDLFPRGQVIGLDLNPSPVHDPDNGITAYQGFQQDTALLDRIRKETAPDGFDVIIDDASHMGAYTAQSFWHLFPNHLKPRGFYILDDWACAYLPSWADGHAYTAREVTARGEPGTAETVRRLVRSSARSAMGPLEKYPQVERHLRSLYSKAEGATMTSKFPSHDYGMAGVVKQIIDSAAAEDLVDGATTVEYGYRPRLIERIEVTRIQTLVVRGDRITP
jgi:hypothetical protein